MATTPVFSLEYNSRGFVSSYQLMGANYSGTTPMPVASAYQYDADGEIKFAQDQGSSNSIKDRAYQYDHAGRLKEAYSGTQARDFVNSTNVGTADGPYRQTSSYDAWDNLLSGGGRFWSRNVVDTASYNQFNRNPNWSYDAEGNLISRNESFAGTLPAQNRYDAAGRRSSVTQTRPCMLEPQHLFQLHIYTNTQTHDGDGQVTRYEQVHTIGINGPPAEGSPKKTYYLRSSVLGGRVISEYDGSDVQPVWSRTHVYAGSERIGSLSMYGASSAMSTWRATDPVTGDEILTGEGGQFNTQTTLDPNGVDVGLEDPFPPPGEDDGTCVTYDPNYVDPRPEAPRLNPFGDSANCIIDDIEQGCGSIGSEGMVQCPNNDCAGYNSRLGFVRFHASADGYAGYLPDGMFYVGDGIILNFLWTGGGSEKLSFDDVEYGSLAQGLAASFTNGAGDKKKKRRRTPPASSLPQQPIYPPVTASEIHLVVFEGEAFQRIQNAIVDAIVDISNRQACSDAFKKWGLTIPYEVVKSGNLKVSGMQALYQPNAQSLLGWNADQINKAQVQFARQRNIIPYFNVYTAEGVFVGTPTIIFNPTAIGMPMFGGLRKVVTHGFIHLGGREGDGTSGADDLETFPGYKEIIDACK